MHWLSKTRYKIGFLIPTLLAYTVFIVLPIIIAIGYSFTKYSGIGKARFNGLTNYIRLFRDKVFWKSVAEHSGHLCGGVGAAPRSVLPAGTVAEQ